MVASSGIEAGLIDLLAVFIIAGGVGVFVAKVGRFPYTIALLLAGLGVSILGINIDIVLSHDLILLVLLPPLLFEGAATTDLGSFRENIVPVLALAVPGLIFSVIILGWIGTYAFGYPLLLALLFAAMVLPTDPVSVLALFEELGAPERLSVLVEGESLLNDGVGVVIFSTLFVLVNQSKSISPTVVADAGVEIVVASLGGLLVGLAAGYLIYRIMVNLDEHMTEIVLTLILAYGSFLLAEHYLHVSGVIATVAAGLFIGNRGAEYAMTPQTKISIFNTWETATFLVNTLIFVLIGAKTPIAQMLDNWQIIAIAIVLTLAVRALIVYPITGLVNRFSNRTVPFSYQHVMVWGGLHASIPIALVLGLPPDFPRVTQLRAMVFGVAAFSLVVQGLTMGRLLDRLDVVTRSETKELYELLLGRARAVDSALNAAKRLHRKGELPGDVYEDFRGEYEQEKDNLNDAISQLLMDNPDLRQEELLVGERRVLKEEKSAIMDAMRSGVVSDDVGERLLEEVDLKLNRVEDGESTVREDPEKEAYTEFWRTRADEYGLSPGND
ncbi:Na+/H+ antiporter [Haladaptatus cibarius]|uniref:Na+/H+ antiporter n=1 Tax=Haladaptatus cibarius TaxID=453847 RepID=UPI000679D74C|nr:Na+/H+ antiporter [Haladaptatus cibarius]